jgi:hypothetical protein
MDVDIGKISLQVAVRVGSKLNTFNTCMAEWEGITNELSFMHDR